MHCIKNGITDSKTHRAKYHHYSFTTYFIITCRLSLELKLQLLGEIRLTRLIVPEAGFLNNLQRNLLSLTQATGLFLLL